MLSIILSIFIPIIIIALTFSIMVGLWMFAKPWVLVKYYKEQGALGYFSANGGFFHDRMKDARQNGDFMLYFKDTLKKNPKARMIVSNAGSHAMLYLTSPDLIKEFVNQPHLYKKAEFIAGIEGLFEGQGILFTESNQWKKQRKIMTSLLHNDFIKDQVPMISRIAKEIFSKVSKSGNMYNIDIQKINQRISGDVIGELFFGKNYHDYSFEEQPMTLGLRKLLKDGFKQMYTPWNAIFGAWLIRTGIIPKHKSLMNRIEDFRNTIKQIITQKKRAMRTETEQTLLFNLLEQQRRNPENAMTDDEIIDNFISLFLAGTDTTGNLNSMIIYQLTQNKEIQEKLVRELDPIFNSDSELNFEKIQKLDYMLGTIKETLRKANPQGILVFRTALVDHKLKDVHIRKGTLVTFSPLFNCYNPDYFANCEDFQPERWLPENEKSTISKLKENPFAFIPFSAGPRACIGQQLALIESKVIIGTFLKTFKPLLSREYTLKMTNRGTYEPLEKMRLDLIPKNLYNSVN